MTEAADGVRFNGAGGIGGGEGRLWTQGCRSGTREQAAAGAAANVSCRSICSCGLVLRPLRLVGGPGCRIRMRLVPTAQRVKRQDPTLVPRRLHRTRAEESRRWSVGAETNRAAWIAAEGPEGRRVARARAATAVTLALAWTGRDTEAIHCAALRCSCARSRCPSLSCRGHEQAVPFGQQASGLLAALDWRVWTTLDVDACLWQPHVQPARRAVSVRGAAPPRSRCRPATSTHARTHAGWPDATGGHPEHRHVHVHVHGHRSARAWPRARRVRRDLSAPQTETPPLPASMRMHMHTSDSPLQQPAATAAKL